MRSLPPVPARLGTGIGALAAVLLWTGLAHAADAVWCHQVGRGDTLSAIARRYGVEIEELRGLNRLTSKATLRPRRILVLPSIRALRRGTLDLDRPPLIATTNRLRQESAVAVRERLSRMRDLAMVKRFRQSRLLVPVPTETKTYYVTGVHPSLRVARPWTRLFIEQVASAFHELFGQRLRITSLTRTQGAQKALIRINPSAAPAHGPVQSTHLTGAAVDVSRRFMSDDQVAWARTVLWRLKERDLIDVAEEFREPHFHVLVRRGYGTYGPTLASPILTGGC